MPTPPMRGKRRTLLVSIDGACWAYADPLLAGGRLPHLAAVMRAGVHGELNSLQPPLTPVAWAGILTGKRSGKNGVYDWVRPRTDAMSFRPVGASDRVGTPIWERLNRAGVRVGLVNVPLTYPPPQLDGFVIGGFMMPEDATDHCHPAGLRQQLVRRFGTYIASVPSAVMNSRDPPALGAFARRVQTDRVAAAMEAASSHPVDVLIVNLMLFDQLNHFEPDRKEVERALVSCDEDLGELRRQFQPDTTLVFSDHGTRRIDGVFLLGRWLADRGYQTWVDLPADYRGYLNQLVAELSQGRLRWVGWLERLVRRIAVELWVRAPASVDRSFWRALQPWLEIEPDNRWLGARLDPERSIVRVGSLHGGLYVDPFGRMPAPARAAVSERLMRELAAVRDPDSGAALFTVHDGSRLYGAKAVGPAPQVLLDCTDSRWNLTTALPPPSLVQQGYFARPVGGRYGEHARVGLFAFSGPGLRVDAQRGYAELVDLAATLLYLYDVPIPDDWDSRPTTAVLEAEWVDRQPVRTQPGDGDAAPTEPSAALDTADLEQRLRVLGYIE